LDTAAAEALVHGAPLQIVHAYVWPIFYATLANVPYQPGEWEPPPAIAAQLEATAEQLAGRHSGLVVRTRVMAGSGGPVLVSESADAAMVVVGGRGIGGVAGLLAGSVAPYVASHAHCPVLAVRVGQSLLPKSGTVIVGVDGSASSLAALRFACEFAQDRDAEVEVVTAEPQSSQTTPARLEGWVAPVGLDHPSVRIRTSLVDDAASHALLAASRSARLVVVGSRRQGELASLVHGSVGHDLIRRSACPVMVVPGDCQRLADKRPGLAVAESTQLSTRTTATGQWA
jgi:nucleotide-binding universal stress UspA family protein